MYGSGYSGKSCAKIEESSPGRGNGLTKYPSGVTSSGDDTHHFRIQLAVHKYNSLVNDCKVNKRGLMTPSRPSLLKNSLRGQKPEENGETNRKSEKKKEEAYDEVGAFPTVHLRKTPVLYRPFRKFNDVKVPYPDLPTSRFLTHLPEFSSQLKKNTRSVIEVLQDLSRKKIHSKEEQYCNGGRKQGLGGGLEIDADAVYKPLFVHKPKVGNVTTKDNTTQTLLSNNLDSSKSPRSNGTTMKMFHENFDPKAELRRKLALQNNEIFASLSSSITSPFPPKRKLDKDSMSGDSECSNDLPPKKAKVFDQLQRNSKVNVDQTTMKVSPLKEQQLHMKAKVKPGDITSKSPNKDRLTTIYLEMQSNGCKSGVFRTESSSAADGTSEKASVSFSDNKRNDANVSGDVQNGGSEILQNFKSSSNNLKENNFKIGKNSSCENGVSVQTGNNHEGQVVANGRADDRPPPLDSNFSFKPSTTFFSILPASKEKDEKERQSLSSMNTNSFSPNSPGDKPQENILEKQVQKVASSETSLKVLKEDNVKSVENRCSEVGNKSEVPEATSQSNVMDKEQSSKPSAMENVSLTKSQNQNSSFADNSLLAKPSFNFGSHNTPCSVQQNLPKEKNSESSEQNSNVQGLIVGGSSAQSDQTAKKIFSFGSDSLKNEIKDAKGSGPGGQFQLLFQPNQTSGSAFSAKSSSAQPSSTENLEKVPIFGDKPPAQTVSSFGTNKQIQPAFSFSFGQKEAAPSTGDKPKDDQSMTPKSAASLFSFSQTESTQGSKTISTTTISQPDFKQTDSEKSSDPLKKPLENQNLLFGQGIPQSNSVQKPDSGPGGFLTPNSGNGMKDTFEAKPEISAFGKALVSPLFQLGNSPFAAKPNSVVSTSGSESVGSFGTSSSLNGFGIPASKPSSSFDVPKTSQSPNGFGVSASTQANPVFGNSDFKTQTSQSPNGFGVSASTQANAMFGNSVFTQANNNFGSVSVTQSSTSSPSTLFEFRNVTPSQSASQFVAPSSTQTVSSFGMTSSPQNSFSQAFSRSTEKITDVNPLNIFSGANPLSSSVGSSFSASQPQSTIFGQKADGATINTFGQSPPSQTFDTQNKFTFGLSSSGPTGMVDSKPFATSSPMFNLGGGSATSPDSGFSFGRTTGLSSGSSNLALQGASNEPFKFGVSPPKESSGFGSPNTFGAQPNNNVVPETNTTGAPFNFSGGQVTSSGPAFNFGSTPSPSVFSFGSSTASSSGSGFNFGASQMGGNFGQPSTSTPAPLSTPGTFSIGWGSSQSKPRAASRLRRRP